MNHDDAAHLSTAHRLLTGHLAPTPIPTPPARRRATGRTWEHWSPSFGRQPGRSRARSTCPGRSCIPPPPAAGPRARTPVGWARRTTRSRSTAIPTTPATTSRASVFPTGSRRGGWLFVAQLLEKLAEAADLAGNGPQSWDGYQQKALDGLVSAEARGAFQIDREDPRLRDRYGRNIHGQCLLLARRLIEAGVGLVTVNWHNDGQNFWDTHGDNFNQLKNRLMPPADQGFSALLDDLDCRGLLDETLVVWVGEFGRTPRIIKANSGREHWPHCYSAVLAGAGVRGGSVFGASDRWAAYPASDPGQPRRPGRDHPSRPGHRPRHDGQGRRRSPLEDQRWDARCAPLRLASRRSFARRDPPGRRQGWRSKRA